jgi:hypothetical protein
MACGDVKGKAASAKAGLRAALASRSWLSQYCNANCACSRASACMLRTRRSCKEPALARKEAAEAKAIAPMRMSTMTRLMPI